MQCLFRSQRSERTQFAATQPLNILSRIAVKINRVEEMSSKKVIVLMKVMVLACVSELASGVWNPFEDPSKSQALKNAQERFKASSGFVANVSSESGRDTAALVQNLEKVVATCSSGNLALSQRVLSIEQSIKNYLFNTTAQFNQALSDRVQSLEQSIKKELTNTTAQSNLALSARVQSLEQSMKNEFATAIAQFSKDIQNLRLMLVSRLTPLAFGVDIAAHASMKCSLKKRDRPLPVGTLKIGDYLYAEEQFCSTDNTTCLYLQSNGNLVLYQTNTLQVMWTANSGGGDCRSFVKMQDDWRVGLYHYPYGLAEWVTPQFKGAELTFRNNGHLCLKIRSKIPAGQDADCLWTTDLIDAPL
ncbi:uncharacterized protein LOC129599965 [Paramacrobiotus metropolitanus]|uniref:uncharacterized protein LOC129599965 n=1 Tax=Paramacrobiotus metropolitanus TaxID=2943436 RepID=UPI002445E3C7|nr:uncharacterized protein LOC129599965 [Paramacrobiotus metropolitanus]